MAQLRSAARGSAFAGSGPGEILNGLGLLTIEDDPENLATAVYGIFDPRLGQLTWASAGHIAPLHAGEWGARYLESAGRPPLGCPVDDPPDEHRVHLEPGEMVVLVTDGVVEQRGSDLGERLEVLRAEVAAHNSEDASTVAEHVMALLCDPRGDDCCVVVLRRN